MKIFKFRHEGEMSPIRCRECYGGFKDCQIVSTGIVVAETKKRALILLKENHPEGKIKFLNEIDTQREKIIEEDEVIDFHHHRRK